MMIKNDEFTMLTPDKLLGSFDELSLCGWVREVHHKQKDIDELISAMTLCYCESPIEQALALAMHKVNIFGFSLFTNGKISITSWIKQITTSANGHDYRPDFLLNVVYKVRNGEISKKFVIECDGHDFHEKTKEQVCYRNQRERDLKAAGYDVIRFSGSEIYADAIGCAKSIVSIIAAHYETLCSEH